MKLKFVELSLLHTTEKKLSAEGTLTVRTAVPVHQNWKQVRKKFQVVEDGQQQRLLHALSVSSHGEAVLA